MNKETLKQILAAMKLHTAETHPLVETERAMEMIEAELEKPEQAPVAYGFYINQEWVVIDAKGRTLEAPWVRLYTAPFQPAHGIRGQS